MKIFRVDILRVTAFIVSIFIHGIHNVESYDLKNLDAFCPTIKDYYKCNDQTITYEDKGCNCDAACNTYQDCCINSPGMFTRSSSGMNQMVCLPVGNKNMGVYAITTCPKNWIGPSQVREKCEGPTDFRDPLNSAPVTSFADSVTYRSRYCAECNDADSLKSFQLKLVCPELPPSLTAEQIYADLRYDEKLDSWGIDRLNSFGNSTNFHTCDITFEVPDYFDINVRLCPPSVISTCPPQYRKDHIRKACEEYMAVVYDGNQGYRNPHCAICNGKTVDEIHCKIEEKSRRRLMSFSLLLDINPSDGEEVGMISVATPECPSNHIYDPFFKKCRKLICIRPGYIVVNGKCVQQTG